MLTHKAVALAVLAVVAALAVLGSAKPVAASNNNFVGGYLLMSVIRNGEKVGMKELAALAAHAETLPVNRIWISFFAPTMVYVPGSNTLATAGLNATDSGDYGFAEIKQYIAQLQKGGVEVFLSMGGWNYNCFPYMYARYSVGGYGEDTPNYWKIETFGNNSIDNCKPENQFCYVCEPPSEGTSLNDFQIFPEVQHSAVWQEAAQYITDNANSSVAPPVWNYDIIPGSQYTDKNTSITVTVPGNPAYIKLNRDPYQDFVYLAKDLGADGIDLDYEEFWHADFFKYAQTPAGPWTLPQTVYKYAAIAKTFMLHIQNIYPTLKLSTAASAVGGWETNWWGGNLKGVWYFTSQWFPEIIDFMSTSANAGGINTMSYDLSDNPEFHECPEEGICTLSQQVEYYLGRYKANNIQVNVGYEIGVPAYPAPDHDPSHQLPLTPAELNNILTETQPQFPSAFFWELYKPAPNSTYVTATQAAQAICKVVLNGASRCSGSIPDY